jgi:hypothetical protein
LEIAARLALPIGYNLFLTTQRTRISHGKLSE